MESINLEQKKGTVKLAGLNCESWNVVPTGTVTIFDTETIIYKDDLQQYGLNVLSFVLNWDTTLSQHKKAFQGYGKSYVKRQKQISPKNEGWNFWKRLSLVPQRVVSKHKV